MKTTKMKAAWLLLALLLVPAPLLSQDQDQSQRPVRGMVEAGTRNIWGTVYGRPDLPFSLSLRTSKFNEYRDVRDGFYVRRFRLNMGDLIGSKYFLDIQSDKAAYRDQSYLATFGQWGRYKLSLRYDEIPHTYTNTARTLYIQTGNGVLTIPLLTRTTLQTLAATAATSLPSTIQTQLVPSMTFITPAIERRAGTIGFKDRKSVV